MHRILILSVVTSAAVILLVGCGPPPVQPVCGNGSCETGETPTSCPDDCPATCGNGVCDAGEDATNCPADCGGSNCGDGVIDPGEDCDGTAIGAAACSTHSPAPYSALADGSISCYPAGSIAADGTDMSCKFNFTGCLGPDIVVIGAQMLQGLFVTENASPSSAEVAAGCAGGTSGRRLLEFKLVSANIGNMNIEFGSPTNLLPPYTGLWNVVGPAGLEWEDYAIYWIEDAAGTIVAMGRKGSFCYVDFFGNVPNPPWSGAPCVSTHDCGNMGQNIGCQDVYDIGLPCQFIDITDVTPGQYLLCSEIDFNNDVAELDDHNNTACVTVNF